MFYGYKFNGKLIDPDLTIFNIIKSTYGLKNSFLKMLEERSEISLDIIIKTFNQDELIFFLKLLYNVVPYGSSVFNRKAYNIFLLDFLGSYRGFRHLRGLPVRGQRTWSNAWSTYKNNNILRNFKLLKARVFYGNIPYKHISIGYIAEQVNLLWRNQWKEEWNSARNSILRFKGHPSTMKIDLYSMYNYQVMHPLKLKKLSKKQKQSFKKNYFSLGFEPGFTKILLYSYHKIQTNSNEKSALLGSSLILKNEFQEKKSSKKASVVKKPIIKKKKKSSWDF